MTCIWAHFILQQTNMQASTSIFCFFFYLKSRPEAKPYENYYGMNQYTIQPKNSKVKLLIYKVILYIYYFMTSQKDIQKDSVFTQQDTGVRQPLINASQENKFDGLDNLKILGYGVGHFINDLAAACWFNYLFLFLKRVVKTSAAPSALLAGQIADGFATPLVGTLSDRTKTKYGQRTPWYVIGLILVVTGYLPLFHKFYSQKSEFEYIYYITFASLFNIGWASLQISHMSLVPSLTCSRKRRDKLNNLRNSFTFISNFIVLGMGVLIFKLMNKPDLQYGIISYAVTALGVSSSLFFLYQIRQVKLTQISHQKAQALKDQIEREKKVHLGPASAVEFSQDESKDEVHVSQRLRLKADSIRDWFKMPKFYLFGVCYMGVRLYTNMYGTFLPFFLIGVLKLGIDESTTDTQIPFTVALVPLITYFCSVLASFGLSTFYNKFGRKLALAIGTIICVICFGGMFFLTENTNWVIYIIAGFIGVSQTMVLSTGINFISDVVGSKAKTGAFVFGIYSLLDKLSSGLAIFFIGSTAAYSKQNLADLSQSEKNFIRYTMILIPSISAVLATLIVIAYPIQQYSKKTKKGEVLNKRRSQIEQQLVM